MRKVKSSVVYIFPAIILFAAVLFLFLRDSTPPVIALSTDSDTISPQLQITATVEDEASPIKYVTIIAKRGGREIPVLDKTFTDDGKKQEVTFSFEETGLKEGTIELEITARDRSFGGIGNGNKTILRRAFTIDATPPRLTVKTSTPYVKKGGTGVILFSANKPLAKAGVQVNDLFFKAYVQENGHYLCFFAFPHNLTPKEYRPVLFAEDKAGNQKTTSLDVNRLDQKFKSDTLNISQGFLDDKDEEFSSMVPGSMTDVERFVKVNSTIRAACAVELLRLGAKTTPTVLWESAFLRLPKSAARAGFADFRTYLWNNQKIDEQTHLGYDFASVANAPVPAANNGIVTYTGYLGIYGNLVIIDHGAGLQSLYSHLSSYSVNEGQEVKKGDIIGQTGKTGMAGGDHLHFGMLVSGFEVTPLEWLDPKWIKDNITSRLSDAGFKP